MIINDKNGNPAAEVDCVIGRTIDGPKNPAVVVKHALLACRASAVSFPENEIGVAVDEASFDAAAARCGDVDAPGFMIDSWESIADLCRLGGFTIELVDGVFRARCDDNPVDIIKAFVQEDIKGTKYTINEESFEAARRALDEEV